MNIINYSAWRCLAILNRSSGRLYLDTRPFLAAGSFSTLARTPDWGIRYPPLDMASHHPQIHIRLIVPWQIFLKRRFSLTPDPYRARWKTLSATRVMQGMSGARPNGVLLTILSGKLLYAMPRRQALYGQVEIKYLEIRNIEESRIFAFIFARRPE